MLSGDKVSGFVNGAVDEEEQKSHDGFELTVNEVYRFEGPAKLDFVGDERADAPVRPHEKKRASSSIFSMSSEEGDEHSWWNLTGGTYLFEYNEILGDTEGRPVYVETLDRLLRSGAYHPKVRVEELLGIPVHVGGHGLQLKENARVSALRVRE